MLLTEVPNYIKCSKIYKLDNNMCAITDKSGVLGLGGIIGGTRSGTEFSSKNTLYPLRDKISPRETPAIPVPIIKLF